MQVVQLLLNVFCDFGGVLFSFAAFRLNVLLQVENTFFHFLCDHVDCFAFLVGDFLETVANFNKFFVGLFYPLLNLFMSLIFLALNL